MTTPKSVRGLHKLSGTALKTKQPGMHADGGGLFLQVTIGVGGVVRRSWKLRYRVPGMKPRDMGLGSADIVSVSTARELAKRYREEAFLGIDPIEKREEERKARQIEAAQNVTFRYCAEAYITAHRSTWKNEKHASQWPATLEAYAYPIFGESPVRSIDVALVMKAIDPIWVTKNETARRLRQRIEAVLDWAAVRGYRQGENPARWRGHLQKALPPRPKTALANHHAAMPFDEVPAFLERLRQNSGITAKALEFCILTAARSGEAMNAQWSELDLEQKVWTIPALRMKAGREHRVPLSPRAVEILQSLALLRDEKNGDWVFPGAKKERPVSNMGFLMTLRRMGHADLTAHGFRSSFRDWAAERTNHPGDIAEAALAHVVRDKVEAAYRRGDLFIKRRLLMDAWAAHCAEPVRAATVAPLRAAISA